MARPKTPAPVPEYWKARAPVDVPVAHAHVEIVEDGHGRMTLRVQNGGAPFHLSAPEMQFWRFMEQVQTLACRRYHERMAELLHEVELDAARLRQELAELREDRQYQCRLRELTEEKLRRTLRYFQQRCDLADSQVQNIAQSLHAAIVKARPDLFDDP